jgi:hypothetical protein
MQNSDIYGYYTCGVLKTYRKWEAIEHQSKSNKPVLWHFNDDVYGAMEWHHEPSQTLSELYRTRAEQLRNRYDYLVLWYSGGADSACVLDSFVQNNIFLDETVSWVNYAATGDRYDFCNGEIFNVAAPKIKQIQEHWPLLRHRVLDVCQTLLDFVNDKRIGLDWIWDINNVSTLTNASRARLIDTVADWKTLADQGKKIAFISGTDKPRLVQKQDGSWAFRFLDMFDNSMTPAQQLNPAPMFAQEFFFWSPDNPLIVLKQAHVLKKFLRHAQPTDSALTKKTTGLANVKLHNREYWLKPHSLHNLIYPNWSPIPYQIKNVSPLFSQREEWFRRLGNTTPELRNYQRAILTKWQKTPDCWKNNPSKMTKGFKQTWSREYNVGN